MSNDHDPFEEELKKAQAYPEALNQVTHRLNKRVKKERRRKRILYTATTVTAASLLFILLVNTSTSFVYALSEIPILNRISQMVLFDESLKSALDNDYIQYVGLSETKDDETLKLPYVIADEQNLVLFFQTDENALAPGEMYEISLDYFRDSKTGQLQTDGYMSTSYMTPDNFNENLGLMQLKINYVEGILPQDLELTVTLWKTTNINGDFSRIGGKSYTFPISLNDFKEPKIYPIEKELFIQDIKVTFDIMKVYPTGTFFHYRTWTENEDNLSLEFQLIEDGKQTGLSSNFFSTSFQEDFHEHTVRIEDNYFNQPKRRSLLISGYRFIEESQQYVTLDLESKTLSRPLENMELLEVTQFNDITTLVFRATVSSTEPPIQYFEDEKGNNLSNGNTRYTTNAELASYVYEIETPKTSKIIMKISPILRSLGKDSIEIPISIPGQN